MRNDALSLIRFQLEHMRSPRADIQIKPAGLEFVSLAVISRITHQITETPPALAELGERKPEIALAGMDGVIDRDQCTRAIFLPAAGDEIIGRAVPIPCGSAFEQLPLAVTEYFLV